MEEYNGLDVFVNGLYEQLTEDQILLDAGVISRSEFERRKSEIYSILEACNAGIADEEETMSILQEGN